MLTKEEKQAIATRLREWPAGLGFVLERDLGRARGWRRAAYRPFAPPVKGAFT